MIRINLIFAASINNIIGQAGSIPWKLPPDLKRFRELTEGDTVIMGRKTYDSLPKAVKPLPMRRNVVISTTIDRAHTPPEVVVIDDLDAYVASLEFLRDMSKNDYSAKDTFWVIGGTDILQAFSKIADALYITRVYQIVPVDSGTVYGPTFNHGEWEAVSSDRPLTYRWEEETTDKSPPIQKRLTYQFQVFKRK